MPKGPIGSEKTTRTNNNTTARIVDDDEGTISLDRERLTKKLRNELVFLPWRNAPPPYAPSAKALSPAGALLSQLRAVLPKVKATAEEAKGTPSAASVDRMKRVYEWKSIDELDVDLGATAFALFRHATLGLETLTRTFVSAKGLDFALEAIAHGSERGLIIDTGTWPRKLVDGVVSFSEHCCSAQSQKKESAEALALTAIEHARPGLCALRLLAAIASPSEYASLVETGRHLIKDVSAAGALAIAVVLSEEEDLVNEAAQMLLRAKETDAGRGAALILASIRDAALARTLFENDIVFVSDDEEDSPCWTLIARVGARAGSILAAGPADNRTHVMGFLQAIHTPASFRVLLPLLGTKAVAKSLQRFLLEHPAATLGAIAPILAKPAKHPDLASAKVLAAAIVKAHPELEAALASSSSSSSSATGPTLPVATAKDLPSFLLDPPWLKKRETGKNNIEPITLEPMRVPTTSEIRDGDLDALAEYEAWGKDVGSDENAKAHLKPKVKTRDDWKKEIAADQKHGRVIDLALMFIGPEDLALEEWTEASDKRRLYYPNAWYGGAFAVALARRGAKFVPGLIRLLRLRPSGADRMPIDVLAPVLLTFDGSDLAELFIEVLDSGKKVRAIAESWAIRHASTMAKAAIPIALAGAGKTGASGKMAANAIDLLRALVAHDKAAPAVISDVARAYERTAKKPVTKTLEALVGTDPLAYFPAKLPKLPDLFSPKLFPPITTTSGGKALPLEALTHVGMMLAISTPESPYAGLRLLRETCTRESLREFSWALFEAWMAVGSPPHEMWILHGLGHLGDDETARRLTPMIRSWPGESAAARANLALGVLANIGTDLALMLLNGIAEKVRFASIQERAREHIAHIAKKRGLTSEELGDRLVPDLDLDPRGETTLDFGPRSFRVGFDEHLEPFIVSLPKEERLKSLPKPAKTDDPAKAKAAVDRFKALKKDVLAIAKARIGRLESAMITGRRWDEDSFRMLFVDKPLVLHLTRRLVWGVYANEKRLATFRVDVDKSLSNDRDESFAFSNVATGGSSGNNEERITVGVVHPLDLSKEELARWGQIFAEYEILQPFPQISREVFRPTKEEKKKTSLESLHDRELPAPKLVFGLEKLGWKRWEASDGGSFSGHSKVFSGTTFIAHVAYDGAVGMGYIDEGEMLSLSKISFSRGKEEDVAVGDVNAAVVSEVMRDFNLLES